MMITSNPAVPKLAQLILISLAVIAVAVADVLLKKAAANGDILHTLGSPWLLGAVGLYIFQIGFLTYVFIAGWKLSLVGALQTALYALVVLGAGVLLYQETLTRLQVTGVLLAIIGVVLISWQ